MLFEKSMVPSCEDLGAIVSGRDKEVSLALRLYFFSNWQDVLL